MTVVPRPGGATRIHHCRACRGETPQRLLCSENGYSGGRCAETYRCSCGATFLSLGDLRTGVPDAEGLVIWVVNEWRQRRRADGDSGFSARTGTESDRWIDLDELRSHLYGLMHEIWARFDPTLGVPFRSYATGRLRNELKDWFRDHLDRNVRRAFYDAVSLDELEGRQDDSEADGGGGLEALFGGTLDDDADWEIDLARVVVLRGGELAELDRRYGV